jgi:hypothetical protein
MPHLRYQTTLLPLFLCAAGAVAGDWAGYLPGQRGAWAAASAHAAQHLSPRSGQAIGTGNGVGPGVIADPVMRTLYQQYVYQGSPAGLMTPGQFVAAYAATGGFTHPAIGQTAYPQVTAPAGTSYVDYYGQIHTLDGRAGNQVNSGEGFYAVPDGSP